MLACTKTNEDLTNMVQVGPHEAGPNQGGSGGNVVDDPQANSDAGVTDVVDELQKPQDTGAGGQAGGGAGGTGGYGADAGPGPTCSGKSTATGVVTGSLTWDGKERTFQVHVPVSYNGTVPTPVVLNLHGLGRDGATQAQIAKMNEKSAAEGFLAVHPDGLNKSWNAGACCAPSATLKVDDVGFIGALLDHMSKEYCVDPRRVFVAGMSNGGFLTNRLGCEMADRIAAIAPVAGTTGVKDCNPSRPIPVLHIHGTGDKIVPYDGSKTLGFIGAPESTKDWAQRNGCKTTTTETFHKDDVTCVTYDGCKEGVEVILCTIEDGGHTWPGGNVVPPMVGEPSNTISATDTIWEFFKKHPLDP